MSHLPDALVYLITDRRQLSPDARTTEDEVSALEDWLDEAIGAVDVIQIRERDLEGAVLAKLVSHVVGRAEGTATRVVVNDRADVAHAANAGGVHLRADGPPVERVRAIGPAGWLVGRSVHAIDLGIDVDIDDVARHAGADYLIFGTVFEGGSKVAGSPTAGLDGLRAAARSSRAPVIAIGGLTPAGAALAVQAGARGVAGIGVFLPPGRTPVSLGLTRAVAELRQAMLAQKA